MNGFAFDPVTSEDSVISKAKRSGATAEASMIEAKSSASSSRISWRAATFTEQEKPSGRDFSCWRDPRALAAS